MDVCFVALWMNHLNIVEEGCFETRLNNRLLLKGITFAKMYDTSRQESFCIKIIVNFRKKILAWNSTCVIIEILQGLDLEKATKEKNQNHNGLAGSFTRLNYLFYVWVLVWSTPKGNGGGWMIVVLFMYRNKNCIFLPTFWNYSILQQGKNLAWQCISDIISWLYFVASPEHCRLELFLSGEGKYSRFFPFDCLKNGNFLLDYILTE